MPTDPTDAQLALLYGHADEAETLEHAAAAAVVLALGNRLRQTSQWLAQRWVREFGSLTTPGDRIRVTDIIRDLQEQIRRHRPDPEQGLTKWAQRALSLGLSQALREIGPAPRPTATIGLDTVTAITTAASKAAGRFDQAHRILEATQGTDHADLMPGIAAANAAVSDLERAARWTVNREVNHGTSEVQGALRADLMWVAERDACVHCLAYSGIVAPYGQVFPPDLTFGDKPVSPWPDGILDRPPLHVNCRCRVTVWIGPPTVDPQTRDIPGWNVDRVTTNVTLADALKREAARSVLKGWATPSEPEAVRLDAAGRLLRAGTTLPKTVQAGARRALRVGHFTTRTVPNG